MVWRGAALDQAKKNPTTFVSAHRMTANLVNQAAPGNVSTRVRFVGTSSG
jgi:hypothetical protein